MFAEDAIAWGITYLLHSTLLLGGAWLASKELSRWSVRAEEAVWRFALVGGLVTASLQIAAGWEPLAGRWSLPEIGSGSAPSALEAPVARTASVPAFAPSPARRERPVREEAPATASLPAAVPLSAPAAGLALWALGAALLVGRSLASHQGFYRRLRLRPRVVGGTLHAQLERLSERSGLRRPVRLTCSSRVPVPVALGLRDPEICVPARALLGLTAEQQEGLLAHELAHVARRDTFWLVFNQLLASVLFFQPLNWVARRRLREISELLSDEWAVGRTGRPVSLARCLAEVAGWSTRSVRALPVPGMADRPSNLGQRIRRLLDETRSPERPVRPFWLGISMAALLALVVAAAPVVSAAVKAEDEAPPALETVQEPEEAVEPEEPAEPAELAEAAEPEEEREVEEELDLESEELEKAFESYGEAFETAFEAFEPAFEGAFEGLDDLDEAFDVAALEELEDLGDDLAELAGSEGLSPEERERLEKEMERVGREMERVSREVEQSLKPHMEKLQQEIERSLKPEMERMQREIERTLQPEMEKLHRNLDAMRPELERLEKEAHRLKAEGGLSGEERERITREAQRLAREASERAMASEDVRRAIAASQEQSREAMRKALEEHRGEIEKMKREIDEQTRALREEARREVERSQRDRRREHRKEKERDDN